MSDDESSTPSRSGGWIAAEALSVIFGTLLLMSLGVLSVTIPLVGQAGWADLDPTRLLGWRLPAWLVLVVVVEVVARRAAPRARAGFLLLAAVTPAVATTVVEVALAGHDLGPELTLIFSGLGTAEFVACAGIAVFTITALFARPAAISTRVVSIVLALALPIGGAMVVALVVEGVQVYLSFGPPYPGVTPDQGVRYILTASIGLGALLVGTIVGFATRRRALGVIGLIILIIGLLCAVVFRVPR